MQDSFPTHGIRQTLPSPVRRKPPCTLSLLHARQCFVHRRVSFHPVTANACPEQRLADLEGRSSATGTPRRPAPSGTRAECLTLVGSVERQLAQGRGLHSPPFSRPSSSAAPPFTHHLLSRQKAPHSSSTRSACGTSTHAQAPATSALQESRDAREAANKMCHPCHIWCWPRHMLPCFEVIGRGRTTSGPKVLAARESEGEGSKNGNKSCK